MPARFTYLIAVGAACAVLAGARGQEAAGIASRPVATVLTQFSVEQLAQLTTGSIHAVSAYGQYSTERPLGVCVLPAPQTGQGGCRTLADLLSLRGRESSIRWCTQLVVFIDGWPLNEDAAEGDAIAATLPVEAAVIDRVEFIVGAGVSPDGCDGFVCVVNLLTRTGTAGEVGRPAGWDLSEARF